MTIGIIGAMEEEVTLLKESMNVVTTRNVIGCDFFVGSVEGSSHNIVSCAFRYRKGKCCPLCTGFN